MKTFMKSLFQRKLSLPTPGVIQMSLGKQGVTDYKRITIRRGNKDIQNHTFRHLTNPYFPRKWKYYLKKVEQYIFTPLTKCLKYGHYKESYMWKVWTKRPRLHRELAHFFKNLQCIPKWEENHGGEV